MRVRCRCWRDTPSAQCSKRGVDDPVRSGWSVLPVKDGCEEFAPAVGACLVKDGLDVVVGGVRGDLQRRGDLLRRQAPEEQSESFCFSWCERVRGDDRWFELSTGRGFDDDRCLRARRRREVGGVQDQRSSRRAPNGEPGSIVAVVHLLQGLRNGQHGEGADLVIGAARWRRTRPSNVRRRVSPRRG